MKCIFGEELHDEMEVALTTTTVENNNNGRKQQAILRTNVKMKMDNLIIDKHLQKLIQNGMEFIVCGIGGGICLYSLPDNLFSSTTSTTTSSFIINDGRKKNTSSSNNASDDDESSMSISGSSSSDGEIK